MAAIVNDEVCCWLRIALLRNSQQAACARKETGSRIPLQIRPFRLSGEAGIRAA